MQVSNIVINISQSQNNSANNEKAGIQQQVHLRPQGSNTHILIGKEVN